MKIRRLLALFLVLTVMLGVSAQGAGTAPDPNPTREDLTLDEIQTRYDDHTHVAYADTHQWPASGTVYVEIAGVFTLSDLNGVTLPANLIIDVYQRYGGDKFRFVVRYDTTDGKSITVTDAEADAEAGDKVAGFDDVSYSDYFAQAVEWAVEEGVTQGTGSGAFSPKSTVTRAEAVTFLWRAAGSPAPRTSASAFSDVTDRNAYYYKAVLWAVEQDITQGVGGGRFNLTGTLAYDQIFTFLCRFAGEEADGADWSAAAVAWARDSGLTDGLSFSAKAACPRSDVVYCLYKQLSDGEGQTQTEQEELPVLTDLQGAEAAIINSLLQLETQIDIKEFGLESSQAEALLADILDVDGYDNYYGVTSYWCTQLEGQTAWTLQVRYETYDPQQMEQNREVTAAVEQVVAQTVTAGMSDYDIAKALHDYLVLNCEYDMRLYSGGMPSTAYTAYGALVDHTAVCAGYAKAYELLMEAAGIPCEYITGYATGNHAWNVVEIDGEWYHVDTTWDDPTPDREGYVRYDYFLKSDAYMRQNLHTRWTSDRVCTSTTYDNADLLDSFEQAKQEEEEREQAQQQAQKEAILQAMKAALSNVPTWTQAELQALSDQELSEALYFTIDMSGSGYDSNTLSKYSREVIDAVIAQHPEFAYGSFQSREMCFEFRRDDVAAEQQRRRDAAEADKEQQQAQDEADALEIVPILENAIAGMDFRTETLPLTGYSDKAIKAACDSMKVEGYTFKGYTYHTNWQTTDYSLKVGSGGVVTLTNNKWDRNELQKYTDQIEAAIDSGAFRVEFQPADYPDGDGDYYAFKAYTALRVEGYVTASGKVSGVDYLLFNGGTHKDSGVFAASLQYPLPEMTEEEAVTYYTGLLEQAVRNGETDLVLQSTWDGRSYHSALDQAISTVGGKDYTVNGLVCGQDYTLGRGNSSAYSGTVEIRITYLGEP